MKAAIFLILLSITPLIAGSVSFADSDALDDAKKPNTTTSRYAFPPKSNDTVFVFVHGIFGDALGTWYNKQTKKYFFDLMHDDNEFKNADFFVYGFPSSFWGSNAWSIENAVADLDQSLKAEQVYSYNRIVLVAHSMGGLVAEQFLVTFRERAKKTSLLFMFSTPQEGSAISIIAKKISGNPGIESMLIGDKNTYLDNLDQQWKAAREEGTITTRIKCAYETSTTYSVIVVGKQSGTRLCDGVSAPVDADHIDIVKPADSGSRSYRALKNAYHEVVASVETQKKELQARAMQGNCNGSEQADPRVVVSLLRHRGDESEAGKTAFNQVRGLVEDRLEKIGQALKPPKSETVDISYLSHLSICYIDDYPTDQSYKLNLLAKRNFLELLWGTFFIGPHDILVKSSLMLNTETEGLSQVDIDLHVKPESFGVIDDLFSAATIYALAVDARRMNHPSSVRTLYLNKASNIVTDLPKSHQRRLLEIAISKEIENVKIKK